MKITTPGGTYLDLRDFYVNADDDYPAVYWLPRGAIEDEVGVLVTFLRGGDTLASALSDIEEYME